ncbi:hypothetical protein NLG97_g5935 [Lecanicillium saksenae]|uniref:Uncharacterized protein n=1 Tax=Lecanicillium saksenae TaxID=468837 RepID=A0ACC1QRL3_9HYPO|nr:hypothetical protein NLG97_g5935 [Lecanicillium saksenae]
MAPPMGKLMAQAVDEIAQSDPSRVFAEFLDPPHTTVDSLTLTFGALAAAVDRLGWWLEDVKKKHQLNELDACAYIGFPDLRYYVVLLACIKCRLKVLFTAPSNSTAAHNLLMQQAGCKVLLLTEEMPLEELKTISALPSLCIPSVATLLEDGVSTPFPYAKTFEEARNDPVVVRCYIPFASSQRLLGHSNTRALRLQYLHSSGTTGRPKLRLWTNLHLSNFSILAKLPEFDGSKLIPMYQRAAEAGTVRYMAVLGIFHVSMTSVLQASIFGDKYCVLTPYHIQSVTAAHMKDWIKRARPDIMISFPAKFSMALEDTEYFDLLATVPLIYYVGAALDAELGAKLSKQTHVCSAWGSTEIAFLPSYRLGPEDWQYVKLDCASLGIEWRSHGNDGESELVLVRNDKLQQPPQYVFSTFPELEEYPSGDLFKPHPTKQHQWRFSRRIDETIILSTAQNINPLLLERQITEHPLVRSATLLGNNRLRLCLVLELNNGCKASVVDEEIWPFIQQHLLDKSQYEQFGRDDVIMVDPKRPLPRGMKGNVVRSLLYDLYRDEIYGKAA